MEKEKIIKALIYFGLSSNQAEEKANELISKGIKFNDILKEFTRRIDKDPGSITNKNCSDGKCCATEIKK